MSYSEKNQLTDIKNEIFPQESNPDNKWLGEGEPEPEDRFLEEKEIKKEESFEFVIVKSCS